MDSLLFDLQNDPNQDNQLKDTRREAELGQNRRSHAGQPRPARAIRRMA